MKKNESKIIHIFAPGPTGGAEKVVLVGLIALKELGLKITPIIIKELRCPDYADYFCEKLIEKNIEPIVVETSKAFDLSLFLKIKTLILRIKPDIIHTHGHKALIYTSKVVSDSIHMIHTHHGNTAHTIKVKFYEWMALRTMKKASAVVAVSEAMEQELATSGVEKKKLHFIPNMLSLNPIESTAKPVSDGEIELICVGRLTPEKGLDILINALSKLKKNLSKQYKLTILGRGSQKDDLKKLTRDKSLNERINFVGFHDDITPFLAKAHALVLPSLREGLPMTLIEATASGLPIIASNVGGIPSLVKDQENGILVTPGDESQLVKALELFPQIYNKLEQHAKDEAPNIIHKFSAEIWAQRTSSLYCQKVPGSK